ncbi:ribosome quality control complex subunit TCF25 [Microcaecilia unicolor]|uniref:Transcription factor 25 n=1 Tax=Microcaecilia unicolor TaxID=1415580 RepID=A0A6P7Y694_9AMPH|nr:transcription factor 25 [Microcaecilia unicolor]
MSCRALRRLRGEQRGQEPLGPADGEPVDPDTGGHSKLRAERGVSNLYELITNADDDVEERAPAERKVVGSRTKGQGLQEHECGKPEHNGHREEEEVADLEQVANNTQSDNKLKKKKKRKKSKKHTAGEPQGDVTVEDIDSILEKIESSSGLLFQSRSSSNTDCRPLLYVEHRNLNPETELKRYFGARAVLGDQRPRQKQRQYHRSTWLTTAKDTWPRYTKAGITMQLLETKGGVQFFTFEHHREYQHVQFKFLEAVESMDPNNIVLLLQMNPYHIDSLLQLSDVCRIQEDQEMARELIERALFSLECAFHPVFSLTSGSCRLDYRRAENRAFFLALFKHMIFLEKRGCSRTALEFCKLILSLDPEDDPLCLLLIIDFLSLRAREYLFLTRVFEEWETHRNLSQLPNFAFSVPLAYFFLSQQEDISETDLTNFQEKAAHLIQNALIMFPGVLMPLLDHCGVQPDSTVSSHSFFGLTAQISQPPALGQLIALYVGRTLSLWKDPAVMTWLEANVQQVLRMVDAQEPIVEECEKKRKIRYQSAPRNIYRHMILSEMKEAVAALPLEVTSQAVLGFDPLPPLDSIVSYTRPERTSHPSNESSLSLFFRSLLPNFNVQGELRPAAGEDADAGRDLNQGVNRLMAAMRDMLANIQFQEPPREDNPDAEGDGDWD